ncbi:type VI secretion system baseplate subunit TssG [Massilia sp. ZL223]|nr:type VI secretion system baseplate subunit TssG [Massilia sp. ZL223]MBQ5964997.1 type VI secretion system baseplate subunit TssG [Massilia sp. ZL223]
MRSAQWRPEPGVIGRLFKAPQRVEFFQAIRLLLRWLARHGIAPERALGGVIRFRNSLGLGFPSSDIEAIACRVDQGETAVEVQPLLMGLLGVAGTLPLHYTERIAAWEAATDDASARAFFDMFSGRQLALFYRAWCKYRVRYGTEDGQDRFLPLLLAIAGAARREGDALPAESLARFAAPLRCRVVPGKMVAGVLAEYLGVPVQVLQFTGRWDVLDTSLRTRLAASNCTLGAGSTVGARLVRPDLGIRLRLGPLSSLDFERFLPGGSGARVVAALLDRFAIELPYRELQVVLRREDVDGASLDGTTRLGLDGFLSTSAGRCDREDLCYLLD